MKSNFLRGMTALFAVLLVAASFATSTLIFYEDVINTAFNIETSRLETNAEASEDTEYYKSDYGEINAENFLKLQADAYAQVENEAAEGAVLLKNDNDCLPLKTEKNITFFGHASADILWRTNCAGTREFRSEENKVDLYEAFTEQGFQVNKTLYDAYAASSTKRTSGSGLNLEEPQSFYTDELKLSWENYKDAAIVVIAREGGEGIDMAVSEVDEDGAVISSLAVHKREREMLSMIQEAGFEKIILLVNSPYQLELGHLDEYGVDACLWISSPGLTGLRSVAKIIKGEINPSGKTVNTWAANSLSSPASVNAAGNFSTWANLEEVISSEFIRDVEVRYTTVQQENIYVGYKYYETRYADCVYNRFNAKNAKGSTSGGEWNYANEICYPFGYGLSYTTFEREIVGVENTVDGYVVSVQVTNTGAVAGKASVQIYAQTPYRQYEIDNGVEKSAIQFVAFDKTDLLEAGETQTLDIFVNAYLLASYDENNAKGYILSAGKYFFAVGNGSHEAMNNILAKKGYSKIYDENGERYIAPAYQTVYEFYLDEMDTTTFAYSETGVQVTNRFDNCDINYWGENDVTYLTRSDWRTFPTERAEVVCEGEEMLTLLQGNFYEKPEGAKSLSDYKQGVDSGLSFLTMKDVAYEDELWETFLDQMTLEELCLTLSNYFGNPAIDSINLPKVRGGDGCDSISEFYFSEEFSDGRGACLYSSLMSATWNKEIIQNRGKMLANEGLFLGLSEGWTGGGNIHRTPFGGRQGEYYSEDANYCYLIGAIELPEMDKRGVLGGMKHFAGNDQETYREGINTFFTEQSFRENSLRAFEGALRVGKCKATMQAFNRLGVVWASSSHALNIGVLREEWGFVGHVITDATMGMRVGYKSHYATSLANGTDLYCLDTGNASSRVLQTQIENTDDGYLYGVLRNAVKNNIYAWTRTCAVNGLDASTKIVEVMPEWQIATWAVLAGIAVLTLVFGCLFVVSVARNGYGEGGTSWKERVLPIFAAAPSAIALATSVYYYALLGTFDITALTFACLSLILAAATVVYRDDAFKIAAPVLSATSFAAFISSAESLGSITDMVQGIVMFGHKEFVPFIVAIGALMLVACIIQTTVAFFKNKTIKSE